MTELVKTKKKKKISQFILLRSDINLLSHLYIGRFLTNVQICELEQFEDRPRANRTVVQRMQRLEEEGYVSSVTMPPMDGSKFYHGYTKGYKLTDEGIMIIVPHLPFLDFNTHRSDGSIQVKRHLESEDFTVPKQMKHHFHTQKLRVSTLKKLTEKNVIGDIFEVEHGDGKEFSLKWEEDNNLLGEREERIIRPDQTFVAWDETSTYKHVIAVEVDRSTMRPKLITEKLNAYRNHINQNVQLYKKYPLTLIFSVEDGVTSNVKRVRVLKELFLKCLESEIYQSLVDGVVIGEDFAANMIADAYEVVPDHMPNFPESCIDDFLPKNKTQYSLKSVQEQDFQYPYPNLAFQPKISLLYQRPSGEQLLVFLVSMREGSVNGQAQLLHLQDIVQEKNHNSLIVGIYPNHEELNRDVFVDYTIESGYAMKKVSFGPSILLSTEEELHKGRAYRVSTNVSRNNKQQLNEVTWKDVVGTN